MGCGVVAGAGLVSSRKLTGPETLGVVAEELELGIARLGGVGAEDPDKLTGSVAFSGLMASVRASMLSQSRFLDLVHPLTASRRADAKACIAEPFLRQQHYMPSRKANSSAHRASGCLAMPFEASQDQALA